MVADPETVLRAYESGVNFFFLTADLHWPLYRGLRRGLSKLLEGSSRRRQQIVVAVVSYLENPLFAAFQFHEILDAVTGLGHVDMAMAGAVSSQESLHSRLDSLARARLANHRGVRAVGATFHQRQLAIASREYGLLDLSCIRFNSGHPGARLDLFPYLSPRRSSLLFNFKSMLSAISGEQLAALGLPAASWHPTATDCYRFVLSCPEIDGLLFAPQTPDEFDSFLNALDHGPLSPQEEQYMMAIAGHAGALTGPLT